MSSFVLQQCSMPWPFPRASVNRTAGSITSHHIVLAFSHSYDAGTERVLEPLEVPTDWVQ